MSLDSIHEETRIIDSVYQRTQSISRYLISLRPSIPHSYLHYNLAGLIKMARSSSVQALLGADTFEKVKNTKILVVGAGGIGCELRELSDWANGRY